MESQPRTAEMLVENFFDGWLSMPSMGSLFDEELQFSSGHSLVAASADPQRQEDAVIGLIRPHPEVSNEYQSSPQASNDTSAVNTSTRKRRGHTKSRLGCISCKKRKIKCQETWPSCANCVKRGCTCRYPTTFQHTQHDHVVSARHSISLSDTPTTYSADDMRLFHHFLIAAHPCLHPEYESVWIRDIPVFSHQYDYLMHSILALAGSHLSIFSDNPSGQMALLHRQKAITGLEKAFSRWPHNAVEAHVMFATSYLLASQSIYITDGFLDHYLFLRGCALLSQLISSNGLDGAFSGYPRLPSSGLSLTLKNFLALDQLLIRHALHSLAGFSHHLSAGTDIERALYAQLVESVRLLLAPIQTGLNSEATGGSASCTPSSLASSHPHINNPLFPQRFDISYEEIRSRNSGVNADVPADHRLELGRSFSPLIASCLIPITWPRDAVLHLFSPSNKLGNIIMAHFLMLQFIVAPICAPESAMKIPMKARIEWLEKIVDAVEDDKEVQWTKYVESPSRMLRTLRFCLNQKRGLVLGDIYDILIKDPGAFREGRLRRL